MRSLIDIFNGPRPESRFYIQGSTIQDNQRSVDGFPSREIAYFGPNDKHLMQECVEALNKNHPTADQDIWDLLHSDYPTPNDTCMDYLHRGMKIQAIKEYRAQSGYGLREAKAVIDYVVETKLNYDNIPLEELLDIVIDLRAKQDRENEGSYENTTTKSVHLAVDKLLARFKKLRDDMPPMPGIMVLDIGEGDPIRHLHDLMERLNKQDN